MNDYDTTDFTGLKRRLTGLACIDIISLVPNYFPAIIESGINGNFDFPDLPDAVQKSRQVGKWRPIAVALMDVELQKHRVMTSLTMTNLVSHEPLPDGEWFDYHLSCWAVLMQGLLSKFEALVTTILRTFPSLSLNRAVLLDKIKRYHNVLKPLRDPIAHPGGLVSILRKDSVFLPFIMLRGELDIRLLLTSLESEQVGWLKTASEATSMMQQEMDRVSATILLNLPGYAAG